MAENGLYSSEPITNRKIILDIDECLVHAFKTDKTEKKKEAAEELLKLNKIGLRKRFFELDLGENDQYWVVTRPHLDKFLNFLPRYFDTIIVWSAARNDYVEEVVKQIFKDHVKPNYILTYDDVKEEKNKDYHKPLSVVNKKFPGLLNYAETLFIDDKADNFREFPDNGIVIPKFRPEAKDPYTEQDDMFLRLIDWLMQKSVIESTDIRKVNKSKIFSKAYSGNHRELMQYIRRSVFAPSVRL